MNGGVGLTGQSPCAAWMSVWHSPLASIRTSTSPAPTPPCDPLPVSLEGPPCPWPITWAPQPKRIIRAKAPDHSRKYRTACHDISVILSFGRCGRIRRAGRRTHRHPAHGHSAHLLPIHHHLHHHRHHVHAHRHHLRGHWALAGLRSHLLHHGHALLHGFHVIGHQGLALGGGLRGHHLLVHRLHLLHHVARGRTVDLVARRCLRVSVVVIRRLSTQYRAGYRYGQNA